MSGKRNQARARALLREVAAEMARQDAKWSWPLTFPASRRDRGVERYLEQAELVARHQFAAGRPSWTAVLGEEAGEVARETDPERLEGELIQLAAVCLSWAQASREERGMTDNEGTLCTDPYDEGYWTRAKEGPESRDDGKPAAWLDGWDDCQGELDAEGPTAEEPTP